MFQQVWRLPSDHRNVGFESARLVDASKSLEYQHQQEKDMAVRLEQIEKDLQASNGETAALGNRVAASMMRLEAIEEQIEVLRHNAGSTVSALKEHSDEQLGSQSPTDSTATDGAGRQFDLRFETKAEELQRQLGALDSQGRDICITLKEQAQRRLQFEEAATRRLESLEKRVDEDFPKLQTEISKLRESFDIETMVREDADSRLQFCFDEAEANSQGLKQIVFELNAKLKSSFEAADSDLMRLSAEQNERRLQVVEDQLRICARNSEQQISAVRNDLLSIQESALADTLHCSTSALLRRVVALEVEQEKSSTHSAQQLADEKRVGETEACIHREETIRALREERELRDQVQMQFERRMRIEAEAHSKEKERRKEVELSLDRRISDLSSSVTEVRQHVRLLAAGVETLPASRSPLL